MFKIRIEDTKEFKVLMKGLAKIIDKATFIISDQGMKMTAIDPTRVCRANLHLTRAWFTELDFSYKTEISLFFENIVKVLGFAAGASLIITPDIDSNRLVFQFVSDDFTRNFRIQRIDHDQEPEFFNETYSIIFKMQVSDLAKIVKSSAFAGDYLTFTMSGETQQLNTFASGDEGDVNIEYAHFSEKPVVQGHSHFVNTATYSLGFLSDFLAIQSIADFVTVEFSHEMPLRLTFHLREKSELSFTLAPRVDEEMEESDEEDLVTAEIPEKKPKPRKAAKKKKVEKPKEIDWSLPDEEITDEEAEEIDKEIKGEGEEDDDVTDEENAWERD